VLAAEESDVAPWEPEFAAGPCGPYGFPTSDEVPVALALPPGWVADAELAASPEPGAPAIPGFDGAVPLVPLLPETGTATLTGCRGRNVCPSRSANPLPSVGFFWLITLDHNESGAPVTVFAALTQV
jgi:hypothetical protein